MRELPDHDQAEVYVVTGETPIDALKTAIKKREQVPQRESECIGVFVLDSEQLDGTPYWKTAYSVQFCYR
jgi:hypothetical protein